MTVRSTLLVFASPIALILTAMPAAAQTADDTPKAAPVPRPQDDYEGDIVVTAQLIRQSPIEVPFALTTLSGRFLDEQGITEFDKLSNYIPGFNVQNQSPNNPGFVIRGITSDDGTAYNEPRVSVFQDGVSISKARGSYVELFDLERVEVAKGPQSTLYGRGALIGAVNIIQAKADPSAASGYVYASYGDYGSYRFDQTVNLPLSDDLAIRVASRFKQRDGYTENLLGGPDYNGIKSEAVRGSLRWAPGALTFDLIGNYQHDKTTGTSFKSIAYDPTDPTTGAVLGDRGRNSGAALAPGANFEQDRPLGVDRDVWGVTGIANYDLSSTLSLNAIGSYRKFAGEEVFDADGISLPVLTAAEDARGDQRMGTLRLTYKNDRVTAFLGTTYFNENGSQRTPAEFDERLALARLTNTLNGGGLIPGRPAYEPAPLSLFSNTAFTGSLLQGVLTNSLAQALTPSLIKAGLTPAQAAAQIAAQSAGLLPTALAQAIAANLQPGHLETSTNIATTNSWDLFGDVTYKLTEKLEIGGGIRWSHDDKSSGMSAAVLNGRSILGGYIGALSLLGTSPATTQALLHALAVPGAANIPTSAAFPVPLFGLGLQPTGNNGTLYDQGMTDSGFTWRANIRYALSDDASIYANYARGRRPEVLSVSLPAAPGGAAQFKVLPSETVDSFEVGAKTALDSRRLMLDGALYYYRYNNFQTTQQQGTTFVTINAGKAESYGFEGQARWNAADWASLFATYSYNHSRFSNGAYEGNHFRLSPDHTVSAGFMLKAPVGPVKLDLSPSFFWRSKQFFDDNNDIPALQTGNLIPDLVQDEFQKGYATVDLRAGLETANGRWRVEGYVTNLLNAKYIKDAGNTGDSLGLPTFIAGEPRFYGLAISMRMGGKR
jgi:outer membrane receptor protein involved in Fe transport